MCSERENAGAYSLLGRLGLQEDERYLVWQERSV